MFLEEGQQACRYGNLKGEMYPEVLTSQKQAAVVGGGHYAGPRDAASIRFPAPVLSSLPLFCAGHCVKCCPACGAGAQGFCDQFQTQKPLWPVLFLRGREGCWEEEYGSAYLLIMPG